MHLHVVRTTTEKLEADLDGQELVNVRLFHVGGRDWVAVIEHADHDSMVGPIADSLVRLVGGTDAAPAWFVYVWDKLSEMRILDLEFIKQHLDPPRWLIDFLEAPVTGESIQAVDTRLEALRRIYDLTSSVQTEGDRAQWALEVIGEVRGLAASQL